MLNKISLLISMLGICIFSNIAFAEVRFIVDKANVRNEILRINPCFTNGFSVRSCPEDFFPNKVCYDDNDEYYDKCCDENEYMFLHAMDCVQIGMIPKDECGGKYSCQEVAH